jgi:MFS family permease
MVFGDRIPRRTSALIGGLLLGSCTFIIGVLYASGSARSTGAARWVVIVLVFIFGLSYCATWGVVGKIYASEIQPYATRSSANSIAQGLGFFTNWLVAISTPILLAQSRFGAYFVFTGFCMLTVIVLAIFMPETKGKSLEDIQEIFHQPITHHSRMKSYFRSWIAQGRPQSSSFAISGTSLTELQS